MPSVKRLLHLHHFKRLSRFFIKPVYALMRSGELCQWERSSVANGVLIGLFCAMLPIPIQSIIAAAAAMAARAHLPLAIGLVWLTNPFTFIPIAAASLWLGCLLLGIDPLLLSDLFNTSLSTTIASYWLPYIVGSITMGLTLGLGGYGLTLIAWKHFGGKQRFVTQNAD